MKIVVSLVAFLVTSIVCFAQDPVWRVLKSDNTTAAEVLNNGNANFNGTVTFDAVSVPAVTVSGGTSIVSTAAALVSTNTATSNQAIRVRVNGTNYLIKLYLN